MRLEEMVRWMVLNSERMDREEETVPFGEAMELDDDQVEEFGAYLLREMEDHERRVREYELYQRCVEVDAAQDSRDACGYGGLL